MSADLSSETAHPFYDNSGNAGPALFFSSNQAVNNKYPLLSKYKIVTRQASESAWIFFVEEPGTSKSLVMKVLRPYSDFRYHLSDVTERLQCQIEALDQNRIFTPEVYIGLARLYNRPIAEDHILIGKIIQYPVEVELEPDAEYALVMERLPDERRLDQLLKGPEDDVQEYLIVLIRHIALLHTQKLLSLPLDQSVDWGSFTNYRVNWTRISHSSSFYWIDPTLPLSKPLLIAL